MRLLADRRRITAEHALRVISVAMLAWMFVWSLMPSRSRESSARIGSPRAVRDSLAAWSASAFSDSIHLDVDTVPDRAMRDWLVALRRNSTGVTWSGARLVATAVAISPLGSPAGGVSIRVAAPAGAPIAIADALGEIDTVTARGGGAVLAMRGIAAPVVALVNGQAARAANVDSLVSRRVAVIGRAHWESKFLIAALEESGWTVDAVLSVAPGVDVTQGDLALIDTANHGVVIMLDSSGARFGARVARFVRQGGGVILLGSSALLPALKPIAAGTPGARLPPRTLGFSSESPRGGLAFQPLASLRNDAVPVEQRGGRTAIAARREGSGRVVQVGYIQSWRWRLMGGENSAEAHREWWSDIVAGAAYRAERGAGVDKRVRAGGPPPIKQSTLPVGNAEHQSTAVDTALLHITSMRLDPAPLASLIHDLGPQVTRPSGGSSLLPRKSLPAWLLLALFAALLTEWASRRLRGAR
ncbi:MAG: hypothetical protein H7Z74_11190 [Anaerolineae bacterium]|nr:hypothetical protein [Gemmatimonadaceae bacterium]